MLDNYPAEALFLVLKLEYKGSSWHIAGESRNATLNVEGNALTNGHMIQYSLHRDLNNIQKNYEILLGVHSFKGAPLKEVIWKTNMTGTISQYMVGYPETKWIDSWK